MYNTVNNILFAIQGVSVDENYQDELEGYQGQRFDEFFADQHRLAHSESHEVCSINI